MENLTSYPTPKSIETNFIKPKSASKRSVRTNIIVNFNIPVNVKAGLINRTNINKINNKLVKLYNELKLDNDAGTIEQLFNNTSNSYNQFLEFYKTNYFNLDFTNCDIFLDYKGFITITWDSKLNNNSLELTFDSEFTSIIITKNNEVTSKEYQYTNEKYNNLGNEIKIILGL